MTLASPAIQAGLASVRLTLTMATAPAYEQRAAKRYLRATALSVQAGAQSCNLVLTRPGAVAIATDLDDAITVAKAHIHFIVERGNAKRDAMVQIIPDTERTVPVLPASPDETRLGDAGLVSAAATLG